MAFCISYLDAAASSFGFRASLVIRISSLTFGVCFDKAARGGCCPIFLIWVGPVFARHGGDGLLNLLDGFLVPFIHRSRLHPALPNHMLPRHLDAITAD